MTEFVGGKIFKEIKSDERVTSDLVDCLYCQVVQHYDSIHKDIKYRIPLISLTTDNSMKQCPACKAIYILGDPTK